MAGKLQKPDFYPHVIRDPDFLSTCNPGSGFIISHVIWDPDLLSHVIWDPDFLSTCNPASGFFYPHVIVT